MCIRDRSRTEPSRSQKLNPTSDPDGIFPSASHGNASYFHGISTDPPDAPAVRHDKYQIVHRLYRRYGADLCTGIWPDLSYDRKIVLSYRRTEITTYKVSPSLAESHL